MIGIFKELYNSIPNLTGYAVNDFHYFFVNPNEVVFKIKLSIIKPTKNKKNNLFILQHRKLDDFQPNIIEAFKHIINHKSKGK